jgi:glycopeptide antibiotics resistance protein
MQRILWPHVMADSPPVPSDPPISSELPRRPHLLALAAVYVLLVTYGSLVPLNLQPMPFNRVAQRVDEVLHQDLEFRSRSDLLVNVMLAIPLSFLLMAGFCADRSRTAAVFVAPAVVLACVLFAAGMEFLQLFFPPRVSSLKDVVSQGLGSCLGVLAWGLRGQTTVDWCRRLRKAHTVPGLAGLLLPSYVVLLILLHMAPFDLITRPKEAAAKWREGRIHFIPFQTCCENPIEGLDKTLLNFAYFLPVGLLWGLGSIRQRPHRLQILHAAATGLLAAGSVEALQLMVFSRSFDATDILTGLLATVLGAETIAVFCRPHDRAATWRSRVFLGLAILVWLAALMNDYWRPFDFSFDSGVLASRLNRIEWLPLADTHHGNDFQAFLHLLDRVLLFLVLGILCTLGLPAGLRRRTGLTVVAAVFVAASILETGQLFLATRHFGISDVLFATLGGWLGYSLIATLTKVANSAGIA